MKKKAFKRKELTYLLLTLLGLAGFMMFYIIPFAISLYLSMIDNNVARNFIGLGNFTDVLTNSAFLLAIKNTLLFLAAYLPLNIILPLFMALLIQRVSMKGKAFFTFIFMLPMIIPTGSMVFFWKSIFGINGIVNGAFFTVNPVDWLNTDYARSIIIFILTWKNAGYNMILFIAGLEFIPKEYYEFSAIEGAGDLQTFARVTLPCLYPTLFFVLIMTVINSFNSFKEIYLLSGAYPHQSIYMLQHYMNNQFAALNYQKLSAASYILSLVFVAISIVIFRKQSEAYRR